MTPSDHRVRSLAQDRTSVLFATVRNDISRTCDVCDVMEGTGFVRSEREVSMLNALLVFSLIVLAAFVIAKVAEAAGLTSDAPDAPSAPGSTGTTFRGGPGELHDDLDFENNFPTMPEDLRMGLVRLVRW